MNKADVDYIIEKLDSYKPDNIYDGYNSVREKQDQRVAEVLDSLKADEIKTDKETCQRRAMGTGKQGNIVSKIS